MIRGQQQKIKAYKTQEKYIKQFRHAEEGKAIMEALNQTV